MGGMTGAGGANKTGATGTNTGTPNWTSGATGPEPGTDAYNKMNTQLSTAPMQSLVNMFQSGGMTPAMSQAMGNLLNTSGSNAQMNQAAQMFQQLGGPEGTANFQNLYNTAGQPGAAQTNLGSMASGGLINNNPYIDAIVTKGQEEAQTGLNQQFAAGGRYGSGTNQGVVADSFQDISNKFRGGQYNTDVQNMMNANQLISGEQLGRMGVQGNAAQGVGGLQTAGAQGLGGLGTSAMGNWLNAQNAAAGIGNQGIQNQLGAMGQLGNVQNNKMFDANQQTGVGQQLDTASQNQINDLINQWTQGDMSGWAKLGGLLSAGTGSASNYGSQSGTTNQSSKPGAAGIIGGILSLVGMMSDRRTKTDIEPIGEMLAGLPLYQFRYRTDPMSLHVGVMADEAKLLHPDAVFEVGGYDHVDYELLQERHVG